MKLAIRCNWAGAETRQIGNDVILVNQDAWDADYALDWTSDPFNGLTQRYPPEKRAFATGEPSPLLPCSPESLNAHYKGAILSWQKQLSGFPQSKSFRYGTTWVLYPNDPKDKKFGIGGVFSGKNNPALNGYAVRREILNRQGEIKQPGMVFNPTHSWKGQSCPYPVQSKKDALDYMFHLAIENCREEGYFSEKLMDCFMAYSIPIYYGDPLIGQIFDSNGIIEFDPATFLKQINQLTPEDYSRRLPAMIENRKRAHLFLDLFGNALLALKGERPQHCDLTLTLDWKIKKI